MALLNRLGLTAIRTPGRLCIRAAYPNAPATSRWAPRQPCHKPFLTVHIRFIAAFRAWRQTERQIWTASRGNDRAKPWRWPGPVCLLPTARKAGETHMVLNRSTAQVTTQADAEVASAAWQALHGACRPLSSAPAGCQITMPPRKFVVCTTFLNGVSR